MKDGRATPVDVLAKNLHLAPATPRPPSSTPEESFVWRRRFVLSFCLEEELRATAQVVTDRETKLQTKDRELLGLQEAMLERDDAGTAQGKKQLQLEFPPDSFFARPVVGRPRQRGRARHPRG